MTLHLEENMQVCRYLYFFMDWATFKLFNKYNYYISTSNDMQITYHYFLIFAYTINLTTYHNHFIKQAFYIRIVIFTRSVESLWIIFCVQRQCQKDFYFLPCKIYVRPIGKSLLSPNIGCDCGRCNFRRFRFER